MHIEHTCKFVQVVDNACNLHGVTNDTALALLNEEALADMNIIVKHEQLSKMLCHPVALGNKPYHIVRVTHNLTLRVILLVYRLLTLCNANDRIYNKFL